MPGRERCRADEKGKERKGKERRMGKKEILIINSYLWNPPHQESRVEDRALSFRTQHHLCRREVAPVRRGGTKEHREPMK